VDGIGQRRRSLVFFFFFFFYYYFNRRSVARSIAPYRTMGCLGSKPKDAKPATTSPATQPKNDPVDPPANKDVAGANDTAKKTSKKKDDSQVGESTFGYGGGSSPTFFRY
jgi:hypothetical protein